MTYCGTETTVEGETVACENVPGHDGMHTGHVPSGKPGLLWDIYRWSE